MNAALNIPAIEWTQGYVTANGLRLAYETAGSTGAPALLLVAGLGCQLTMWPDAFCLELLNKGYRVIRFDNRDIGLSEDSNRGVRFNIPMDFVKARLGLTIRSNYTLHDMADDAAGLIEALKLDKPHVVGISMGGMISQLIAAKYPGRVGRLSILMSSTNSPRLPGPTANVVHQMFLKAPRDKSAQAYCEHVARVFTAIGSPQYPTSQADLRSAAMASFERSRRPAGVLRQTNAIMASGSIEKWTAQVKAPTLVIHGQDDPLLRLACGQRVAQLIPAAKLEVIPGMGHDLPGPLLPRLAHLIHQHGVTQ